jgi:hypothetical protein
MGVLDHRGVCVGIYASQNKFPGTKPIFVKIPVIDYITGEHPSALCVI